MGLETLESEVNHLPDEGHQKLGPGYMSPLLEDMPISLGSVLTCTLLDLHLGLLEPLQHATEVSDAVLEGDLLIFTLLGSFQELPNLWGYTQIIIIFLLLLFLLDYFPGGAGTSLWRRLVFSPPSWCALLCAHPSMCPFIFYPCTHTLIRPPIHPFISLPISPYTHPSIRLSMPSPLSPSTLIHPSFIQQIFISHFLSKVFSTHGSHRPFPTPTSETISPLF